MGDSDDEYDRKRRDKFRGERSDSYQRGEGRRGNGDDRRRDEWIERDSWGSRTRPRTDYRDYRGSARERYSPTRAHDISPPLKRMRTDWDDRRYAHESSGAGYPGYSSWGPDSYSQPHYSNHSFPQRVSTDAQGNETQPPMLSFKAYLQTQDDSITDAEALRKYGEYKLEFKRQQLNEFFVAHKEEEWFKIKYHPEDSVRRKDEQLNALKRRVGVFIEFLEKGRLDKVSVDSDQSEALIKLLDAVVIRLEGGTDNDLLVLDHVKETEEKKESKEENEKTPLETSSEKAGSPKENEVNNDNNPSKTNSEKEDQPMEEDPAPSSPKEIEDEGTTKKENENESVENPENTEPPEPTSKNKHDPYDSDSGGSSSEDEKASRNEINEEEEEEENKSEKDDSEIKENKKETPIPAGSGDDEPEENKLDVHADEELLENEEGEKEEKGEQEPESPKKENKSDDGTEDISDKEEMETEEKEEKEAEEPKEVEENGETEEGESVKVVEQTEEPESATKSKSVSIDDENKPRPLHKTASIFLRNLAPTITKAEVEAMCKRFPGFLRVAIADPQPERRWFRRGWVTFERQVNIKEICWNLNNIRLRDCELGAIVNRDLSRRIRTVNGITSHKHVVRHDIKLSARIVHNLDSKCGLWAEEGENEIKIESNTVKNDELEKQLLSFGLVSNNPVLRNITDYLIEEASAEEEELLGVTTDQEEGQIGADTPAANRDENLLKVLDKLLLYLRIVHSVDYYNHCEYPIEDEMPNRCGIMHARGTPPSSRVTLAELQEYCRTFENKIAAFLQPPATVPDEEYGNLGHKDPDAEVEKFVLANTQELAKDKWLCPLSGKKFKGPEFVRKHIFNKHTEKVEEVRKEVAYFNNYLRDPKRPQLAEHPGNASSSGSASGRSASGRAGKDEREIPGYPAPGGFPHHYQYGYGRHGYGSHYPGYGSGYNQGYGGQGSYGRPNRGGGYNRGRGSADFRPVIHYRDLDAPRELEEFI